MKTSPAPDVEFEKKYPLKTLYNLYQNDKRKLAAGIFFTAIKHTPVLVTPIVTANIFNALIYPDKHSVTEIWVNVFIILIVSLQNIPTYTLTTWFLSRAMRNMEATLRGALVRRLQQLSIGFHDKFMSGRLQSKVLMDVESLTGLSNQLIGNVFLGGMNIIVAVIVTLQREPRVALFYVFTVPLALILLNMFSKKMKTRTKEFRTQVESMSARIAEMVDMIPITRAHGVEEVEIQNIDSRLSHVKNAGFRLDLLNAVFGSSSWVTFQVFQLICLCVTGYMAFKGKIPIGDVILYQGYFGMIIGSANMLLNMYPQITRGMEAITSISELLESPDIERNVGKKPVSEVMGDFSFENTGFTYSQAPGPAVRDLTLHVKAGECVAFVGESGAGKSTILNLIIGFRRPTQGRILLDGVDMETLDLRQFRQHIAVVTQNTILFSGSVRDNITYGLCDVSDERVTEAIRMANAEEFISRMPEGIATIIGERGKTLSGGQQQRIAIARALIRDPKVIILDEATSALDVISEALVQQAIERLIAGRTTFVVAHRLSTIRIADRIVVLKDGACIEKGTHDELMSMGSEFFRLKTLQV